MWEAGERPNFLVGRVYGTIAAEARGTHGWGHDPIFIPAGKRMTYGESKRQGEVGMHRIRSILKLKKFLISRRR